MPRHPALPVLFLGCLALGLVQLGSADAHAARRAGAASPVEAAPPPPPQTYGLARRIHPPTPCDVPTWSVGGPGAPYVATDGVPRAGQPFRAEWSTKPTAPGEPPAWPALLLISFELSAPMPLAPLGAPGCHLLVEPDFIMTPQAGSILTQTGGRLRLDWTPQFGVIGQQFFAQMLCYAPGVNAGGFLVSPALHTIVGS